MSLRDWASLLFASLLFGVNGIAAAESRPSSPIALEAESFPNPEENLSQAIDILAHEWYDPSKTTADFYEHALRGLVTVLGFQDHDTAATILDEVSISTVGADRFRDGVGVVLRKWANTGLSKETVYFYALQGLVRNLSFDGEMLQAWPPEVAGPAESKLTGKMVSIGVTLDVRNARLIVTDVVPGGPADRAGIKPGDRIAVIDGDGLGGKGLREAEALLYKAKGSRVRLELERASNRFSVVAECEEVVAKDVRGAALRDVGLIRILNFSDVAVSQFEQVRKDLRARGVKALVLDLRASPGGRMWAMESLACSFLKKRTVLYYTLGRDKAPREKACSEAGDASTPLVALINETTVSAGEILAAALRGNRRSTLIGRRTKGYGAIKENKVLRNGVTFRIITGEFMRPERTVWLSRGIDPDIEVSLSEEDLEAARLVEDDAERLRIDRQLAKAVESVSALPQAP